MFASMTTQMSETPARIPIVMELETGDLDDILAFLLILEHPRALLKAIVMSPGSPDQIGLIKHLLTKYHHPDVPIGAFNLDHPKPTVSEWHYKTFGHFESNRDAVDGAALILELCTQIQPSFAAVLCEIWGKPFKSQTRHTATSQ